MTIIPNRRRALKSERNAVRNTLRLFFLIAVISLLGYYIYKFC
jgi:hypothetical protein